MKSLLSKTCKYNFTFNEKAFTYTNKISSITKLDSLPQFRVIDLKGNLIDSTSEQYAKKYSPELLNQCYETMIKVEEFDDIMNKSQRQGVLSFYMQSFGELATVVGATTALNNNDTIFSQYREQAALFVRGFKIKQFIQQCMGTEKDLGKGRQMPIHYGSDELNFITVSSPLTTQVPQAAGAGYAYRQDGLDRVAATYCGEGATSEGDFSAALNFAATLNCQTMFFVRNNGFAISTSTEDQFATRDLSMRGVSFGIQSYRVDGNDLLAVLSTVEEARRYVIENKKPVYIEFMTYRIGDHSTSDHSVLYRNQAEIDSWKANNNPITRLGLYLRKYKLRKATEEQDKQLRDEVKKEVIKCLKEVKNQKLSRIDDLFNDVYDELTPNLEKQRSELKQHLEKYPEHYNVNKFIK